MFIISLLYHVVVYGFLCTNVQWESGFVVCSGHICWIVCCFYAFFEQYPNNFFDFLVCFAKFCHIVLRFLS